MIFRDVEEDQLYVEVTAEVEAKLESSKQK
jgi:hypothetical protein